MRYSSFSDNRGEDWICNSGYERAAIRRFAEISVKVLIAGHGFCNGEMRDISEYGCLINLSHSQAVEPGNLVLLKPKKQKAMAGTVAWGSSNDVGIRFLQPLTMPDVENIVRSSLLGRLNRLEVSPGRLHELPPLKHLLE